MVIQHNIGALNSYRNLGINQSILNLRNCLPVTESTVQAMTRQVWQFPSR